MQNREGLGHKFDKADLISEGTQASLHSVRKQAVSQLLEEFFASNLLI